MTPPNFKKDNPKELFFRYFTDSDFAQFSDHFFKDPECSADDFWEDEEAVDGFFKLLFLAGLMAKGMVDLHEKKRNFLPVRIHKGLLLSLNESEYSPLNEFGGPTFNALAEGFQLEQLNEFFVKKELDWASFAIDLENYFHWDKLKNLSLNIYSKKGAKLIYLDKNGYDTQREEANKFLKKGEIYTVDHVDIFKSTSTVFLKEFPGMGFNMVMFRNHYPTE